MRPAFIAIALAAFALARPFDGDSSNVVARAEDGPIRDKVKGVVDAAAPHVKALGGVVAGHVCNHVKAKLGARGVDGIDVDAAVDAVAEEMFAEYVAEHQIEDSSDGLWDAIKKGAKTLATHVVNKGCDAIANSTGDGAAPADAPEEAPAAR
ncbi:hypothetical protein PLEOSDRAFT_1113412 [Pleurotus ostreatus PC15]|uniref:Uncharacterized protein n=1 Tax=Pleurotus ostreatus (strain PC15) TaxID=1137138 RepID=A0A067NBG0_PLEO1|nr:hypothetical protein PLEOSDRAFT_1097443 [Pleurotus ostreatus PC15]KDQ25346.1 hypothetical protein PLEOSDRAFT_1113412 [Pleurotus ostreatus PC15]